jgi:hypothetical protein
MDWIGLGLFKAMESNIAGRCQNHQTKYQLQTPGLATPVFAAPLLKPI